jgi:transposase
MKCILKSVESISKAQRFVLPDLLDLITYMMRKESMVEDEISRSVENDWNVSLLMTIPGIGIYSSAAIMSEIDDISRFSSKEKLASYAPVTGQNQSGSSDIRGHITKHGPSMLRFILVNAAHSVIKFSDRMRRKYLSLVRRLGRNRAIVAIARTLIETIYTMLSRGTEFIDRTDSLTERKMVALRSWAMRPSKERAKEELMNDLMILRNERQKRISNEGQINNVDAMK